VAGGGVGLGPSGPPLATPVDIIAVMYVDGDDDQMTMMMIMSVS